MQIYHYDSITGEYAGTSQADESPLEPDVFLMPAHATAIAPPAVNAGECAVFRAGAWQVLPDHRGETHYDVTTGAPVEIKDIGAVPAGLRATPPPPSTRQIIDALEQSVQRHLDEAAQARGYDNIFTACTYADEPAVAQFQAEGMAFRAWRSLVWAHCYQVLAAAQAGTRAVPGEAELIAELPALGLP
ncbi:MAG: hypothetical protein AB1513_11410 [Pseudomonadota bacterium]